MIVGWEADLADDASSPGPWIGGSHRHLYLFLFLVELVEETKSSGPSLSHHLIGPRI